MARHSYPLVGRSVLVRDRKRRAKKAGWRRTKRGKYFENRRNRADKNPRKRL